MNDDAVQDMVAKMEAGEVVKPPALPSGEPDVPESIKALDEPVEMAGAEVEVESEIEPEAVADQDEKLAAIKAQYEAQLQHFQQMNQQMQQQLQPQEEYNPLANMPELPPEYEEDPRFDFLKRKFVEEAKKAHTLEQRLASMEQSTRANSLQARAQQLTTQAESLSDQYHYADPETILAKYHALGGQKTLKAIARETHNAIVSRVRSRRGKKKPPTSVSKASAPSKASSDNKGLSEVFGDSKDWKSGRKYLLQKYGVK